MRRTLWIAALLGVACDGLIGEMTAEVMVMTGADAGTPPPDAGIPVEPEPDAGASVPDAGSVALELAWDAPGLNADGSPLTDLAGYRVYVRPPDAGAPLSVVDKQPQVRTHALPAGGPRRRYTVTAYDTSGNESAPSGAVVHP